MSTTNDGMRDRRTDALSPRRVLIASADPATLTWGRRWLDRVGFEADSAVDSAELLEKVGTQEFGLVLLDDALELPEGGSLCAELRKVEGAARVPVLSLCSGAQQALTALEDGSTDVILRPYDWRILIRRAELLYRGHETRRARERAESRFETLDPLTGIPNRHAFQEQLERVARLPRAGHGVVDRPRSFPFGKPPLRPGRGRQGLAPRRATPVGLRAKRGSRRARRGRPIVGAREMER